MGGTLDVGLPRLAINEKGGPAVKPDRPCHATATSHAQVANLSASFWT